MKVLAVSVMRGAPLDYWKEYLERYGAENLTYAQDPDFDSVHALKIQTSGATVIIDREGKIVFRDRYTTPFEILKEAVEKVL